MALLEITIGLVFILAFLSLVCSAIQELIASFTQKRAAVLQEALSTLLQANQDGGRARDAFLQHPVLRALSRGGDVAAHPPSYIPATVFAEALIDDIARRSAATGNLVQDFRAGLATLGQQGGNPALARALAVVTADVQNDVSHLKARLSAHFDTTMERVSGWYKRHVSKFVAVIAVGVAGLTNADVFSIGSRLASDATLRAALVAAAEKNVAPLDPKKETPPSEAAKLKEVLDRTKELNFPLGWSKSTLPPSAWSWMKKIVGILITAAALTLGAGFWFDTLKLLLNLRSSGLVPKPRT